MEGATLLDEDRERRLRRARHVARDRVFGIIFVAMVVLGLISLYYSLNWSTGLVLLGLVLLILGIGWITGTLAPRDPDRR